jgi:hypothetical protein
VYHVLSKLELQMGNAIPNLCTVGMIAVVLFFFNCKLTSSGKIITNDLIATIWKTIVVIQVNINTLSCARFDTSSSKSR